MWQAWTTGVLGIWLIIASFTISGNIMNELIVGVVIAILGFWGAIKDLDLTHGGQRIVHPKGDDINELYRAD